MNNYSYFSDLLNLQKIASYILNIGLDQEGVSYSIYDSIRKVFLAVVRKNFVKTEADLLENLQNIIIDDIYLNKHYKQVNFIYHSSNFTLFPEEFFCREIKNNILETALLKNLDKEEILYEPVTEMKIVSIFSYPTIMLNFLINQYPEIKFSHTSIQILNSLKYLYTNIQKSVVILNYTKKLIFLGYYNGKEIEYFGHIENSNEKDQLFYIFSIAQKYNLWDKDFYIQGELTVSSEITKELRKYFRNLKFYTKFDDKVEIDVSPHIFANILIV